MTLICGIDEAGRGPLCGPVFASAVIFESSLEIEKLNDSKKFQKKIELFCMKKLRENLLTIVFHSRQLKRLIRLTS